MKKHKPRVIKTGDDRFEVHQEVVTCAVGVKSGVKCNVKPTRWYKILGTTVYRCEKHKNDIESPVYDQGKISSRGELIGLENDPDEDQDVLLTKFYRQKSRSTLTTQELEEEVIACKEEDKHKNFTQDEPNSQQKLQELVKHFEEKHPKLYASQTYYDSKGTHNLWLEHPEEYFKTVDLKLKFMKRYGRPIPKKLVGTDLSAKEFREIPPEHIEKVSRDIMDIKESAVDDYEKYDRIEKLLKSQRKESKSPEKELYDFLQEHVWGKYPVPPKEEMHKFIQEVYEKEPQLRKPIQELLQKVDINKFLALNEFDGNEKEAEKALVSKRDDVPEVIRNILTKCKKCKEIYGKNPFNKRDDELVNADHVKIQKDMKKHFKKDHRKEYPVYKKYDKKLQLEFKKRVIAKNVEFETSLEIEDEKGRLAKAYRDSVRPDGSVDNKKLEGYLEKRKKELQGHVRGEDGKCLTCKKEHTELDILEDSDRLIKIVDKISKKIPDELYDCEITPEKIGDQQVVKEKINPVLTKLCVDAFKEHKITDDLEQEAIVSSLGVKFMTDKNIKDKAKGKKVFLNETNVIGYKNALGGNPNDPKKKKIKRDDQPTYEEAREYALDQDCRSVQDWINHTKTEQFDKKFPLHPHTDYKPIFQEKGGYPFFLGYTRKKHRPRLTQEEVQKIIKKFDARWVTDYQMYPDAMLMTWFENQGLFKVKDPLEQILFKNLISWRTDPEGMRAIRFYFHSITIGDLSGLKKTFYNPETDRVFSLESKDSYIDRQYTRLSDVKPQQLLANPEMVGVAKIMDHALSVVPDENDRDWWNFQVYFSVKLLWYAVFDEETGKTELAKIYKQKKGQNNFHDAVLNTFLKQYKSVISMSYKERFYTYEHKPFLNQLYCAWMMRRRNFFFDMSSTGCGKSGCGLISAMSQNTKRCVIICPKNIVVQWNKNCKKFYKSCYASNSEQHRTHIPNEFFLDNPDNKANFHIINYDKFNNATSANTVVRQFELRNPVDMIILDESQRVKSAKEDEKEDTATRRNVSLLIAQLRKDNRNLKVLMLSATPVVNKISEGKSLLEMGTGTDYTFSTYPTVLNASKLYTEFQPYCMRWVKQYPIEQRGKDDPIIVRAYVPEYITKDQFHELHWDDFDEFNTKYRIATILKLIKEAKEKKGDARIIIYTDYIDGIVDQLQVAMNDAGLRYGLFIGADKSGMIRKTGRKDQDGNDIIENPFVLGELDVLIASSPIAVGVDDLQYDCNNIIFNGLVWTWAKFEQIVGRLVRTGQTQDHVNINLVFANLNGYEYDYKVKYLRILAKKSIGDCITTGTLPPKISLGSTEEQRHGMITKMWNNKESGFPEKERIDRELQLEAEKELETEIEKTNEFLETIQPVEPKEEENDE